MPTPTRESVMAATTAAMFVLGMYFVPQRAGDTAHWPTAAQATKLGTEAKAVIGELTTNPYDPWRPLKEFLGIDRENVGVFEQLKETDYELTFLIATVPDPVDSRFFIVSGLLLFFLSRRLRARSAGLAEADLARMASALCHKVPRELLTSSPRVPMSDPSGVERSKASDDHADRVADFGALGKRADVKKLIEELHNQTPKRLE